MGTLIIDRKDVELRHDGARITVYEAGSRTSSIPVRHVDRVVVHSNTRLDTGLLGLLAEHGVGFSVINLRKKGRAMHLLGLPHNDASRRMSQYRFSQDEDFRRTYARDLIRKKLAAGIVFLDSALSRRPDRRHALMQGIASLSRQREELGTDKVMGLETLRGIEGSSAALYFKAYRTLFPTSLGFNERNRRPPRDPVNACLSLGYTLAHALAVVCAHRRGLDPLIGFFHDTSFGRESLASDLIEPERSRVDRLVWVLFADRELRLDHFSSRDGACLLNKEGRKRFYERWAEESEALEGNLNHGLRDLLARLHCTGPDQDEEINDR